MLIGMGGGAASSMGAGTNTEDLDFDSVQRGNAEIQRRAQEVIDRCWALGEANPILSIHDVGAGGLSNALPELAHGAGRGAHLDLRAAPSEDSGMSPREIWCNEAQERYVLAIAPASLDAFRALCERERCPFAVLGTATADGRLKVEDPQLQDTPVDVPLEVILGKPPKMLRDVQRLVNLDRNVFAACMVALGHADGMVTGTTRNYATALDDRDWKRLATCFTADAVALYGPVLGRHEGFTAIENLCRVALEPLDSSHHMITNHEITIEGDTAHTHCYLHAQHTKAGTEGGDNFVIAGSYVDELVRTPQGWRIRQRELRMIWQEGNSRVLGG